MSTTTRREKSINAPSLEGGGGREGGEGGEGGRERSNVAKRSCACNSRVPTRSTPIGLDAMWNHCRPLASTHANPYQRQRCLCPATGAIAMIKRTWIPDCPRLAHPTRSARTSPKGGCACSLLERGTSSGALRPWRVAQRTRDLCQVRGTPPSFSQGRPERKEAASLLRNRARFVRPRCTLEEHKLRFLAMKR